MAHEFRVERRVEFADTDMAGIMHFANYFRFMEAAEHAFFRSLGISVHIESPGRSVGFARKHAECTFGAPLRYEDVVELHVVVREIRERSIDYEVVFRKDGGEIARGALTAVYVEKPVDGPITALPIPPEVRSLIETAPG